MIERSVGIPVQVPYVGSSRILSWIPGILSLIAGSTDVISFLALSGLFTAHITGNLVVLAAHIVTGGPADVAAMLSVPVFMAVLGLTKLLAAALEWIGIPTLRPLLLIQFLLLAGFLFVCVAIGTRFEPQSMLAVTAGMLGVSAMAVQNALVQISLRGAPSTAVMTTNLTRFMMDCGEVLLGRDPQSIAQARISARHTWPAIAGFATGGAIGAACEALFGLWSLVLPTGLALLAFAMALADYLPKSEQRSEPVSLR
jgi:uncharacterized membrane protein YoaK (UPF0700 family)